MVLKVGPGGDLRPKLAMRRNAILRMHKSKVTFVHSQAEELTFYVFWNVLSENER